MMIDSSNPDYTNTPVSEKRAKINYLPFNMDARPAVSIITPFFNTGRVFQETVECVLRQTFQQWEWIIVNDCSTNSDSVEMLNDLLFVDKRVRVINHLENKGPSEARHTGFLAACSDFLVLLDSDDLLEPTAIEKWFWFLETHPEYAFTTGFSLAFEGQEYLWPMAFENSTIFLEENSVVMNSMIRKSVYETVGGFDTNNREGLEDWEFWLKCADAGYWGGTVPEYLSWYRRRPDHTDRWVNFSEEKRGSFRQILKNKYPKLWEHGFPKTQTSFQGIYSNLPTGIPCSNLLQRDKSRLLMIIPWLEMGGADKFNLDLIEQLKLREYEITVAATLKYGENPWLPEFTKLTEDVFILKHFLTLYDYPRFISYLITSRQISTVLISNSETGYNLLPFLRALHPDVTFIDYCHMEEEYWHNGGYPQLSVNSVELLDLHVVSSHHLKNWMVDRGLPEDKVAVCYTNIDPEKWKPDAEQKKIIRSQLKLNDKIPVMLYAGRITGQKQPKVFAKTILYLAQKKLDFKVIVAGDGPDLPWLQGFVNDNKLSKYVVFLGAVSNKRIKELLNASDIFFLPSAMEGISLAIFEAMSTAVVPVGADVGGQKELVTEECGFLLPRSTEENEAKAYAEVLAELIEEPEKLKSYSRAARERIITNFRLECMGEQFVELLELARQEQVLHRLPALTKQFGVLAATRGLEVIWLDDGWRNLEKKIYELEIRKHHLFEEKLNEMWVRDVEINRLKATRGYQLEKAIVHDKLSVRKFINILYLLVVLAVPVSIQKKIAPILVKLRR